MRNVLGLSHDVCVCVCELITLKEAEQDVGCKVLFWDSRQDWSLAPSLYWSQCVQGSPGALFSGCFFHSRVTGLQNKT